MKKILFLLPLLLFFETNVGASLERTKKERDYEKKVQKDIDEKGYIKKVLSIFSSAMAFIVLVYFLNRSDCMASQKKHKIVMDLEDAEYGMNQAQIIHSVNRRLLAIGNGLSNKEQLSDDFLNTFCKNEEENNKQVVAGKDENDSPTLLEKDFVSYSHLQSMAMDLDISKNEKASIAMAPISDHTAKVFDNENMSYSPKQKAFSFNLNHLRNNENKMKNADKLLSKHLNENE